MLKDKSLDGEKKENRTFFCWRRACYKSI